MHEEPLQQPPFGQQPPFTQQPPPPFQQPFSEAPQPPPSIPASPSASATGVPFAPPAPPPTFGTFLRLLWPSNVLTWNGLNGLWRPGVVYAPDDYPADRRLLMVPVPAATPLRLASQAKFALVESALVAACMQLSQVVHLDVFLALAPDEAMAAQLLFPQALIIASYLALRWPLKKAFPSFMRMPLAAADAAKAAEAAAFAAYPGMSASARRARSGFASLLFRLTLGLLKLLLIVYITWFFFLERLRSLFVTTARSPLDLTTDPLVNEIAMGAFVKPLRPDQPEQQQHVKEKEKDAKTQGKEAAASLSPHGSPRTLTALVATGPALEELFFRGLVLARFARVLGVIPGLALSSALFASIHRGGSMAAASAGDGDEGEEGEGEAEQALTSGSGGAGAAGVIFGASFLLFKTLWAPVLLHAAGNVAVALPALLSGPMLPMGTEGVAHALGVLHTMHAMAAEAATIAAPRTGPKPPQPQAQGAPPMDPALEGWLVPSDARGLHMLDPKGTGAQMSQWGPEQREAMSKLLAHLDSLSPLPPTMTPPVHELVSTLFTRLDRGGKGYLDEEELAFAATLMPDHLLWMNGALSVLEQNVRSNDATVLQKFVREEREAWAEQEGPARVLQLPRADFFAASAGTAAETPSMNPSYSALLSAAPTPAWSLLRAAVPVRGPHEAVVASASTNAAIAAQSEMFQRYYTLYWRAFYQATFPKQLEPPAQGQKGQVQNQAEEHTQAEHPSTSAATSQGKEQWEGNVEEKRLLIASLRLQRDAHMLGFVQALTRVLERSLTGNTDTTDRSIAEFNRSKITATAASMGEHQSEPLRECTRERFEQMVLTSLWRRPLPTQRWLRAMAEQLQLHPSNPHPAAATEEDDDTAHPIDAMLSLHERTGRQVILLGQKLVRVELEIRLPQVVDKMLAPPQGSDGGKKRKD